MTNEEKELLLYDRLEVIRATNKKYDLENNAYISFSGGKDSTVLHNLVDIALPNNNIPRVFINTGIEYNDIVSFVKELASNDKRFVIIAPTQNVRKMLERVGFPFKSKEYSNKLEQWKHGNRSEAIIKYFTIQTGKFSCPKILKYQMEDTFKLKVSNKCCEESKKKPSHKWAKENNKPIVLTGMRKEEGGERTTLKCAIIKGNKLIKFHPLTPTSDEWEEWFINKYNIQLCKLYYPPYNFKRTGCKGCPFAITLQEQLDTMGMYLPAERKQCEYIWKPVYDEYRRIGYRLRKDEPTIFDFMEGEK